MPINESKSEVVISRTELGYVSSKSTILLFPVPSTPPKLDLRIPFQASPYPAAPCCTHSTRSPTETQVRINHIPLSLSLHPCLQLSAISIYHQLPDRVNMTSLHNAFSDGTRIRNQSGNCLAGCKKTASKMQDAIILVSTQRINVDL